MESIYNVIIAEAKRIEAEKGVEVANEWLVLGQLTWLEDSHGRNKAIFGMGKYGRDYYDQKFEGLNITIINWKPGDQPHEWAIYSRE
jgi:hypothetical protein